MPTYPNNPEYSEKYEDDSYEYRHVFLTKAMTKAMWEINKGKVLLTEEQWRSLGVQQSPGWEHYAIHSPEVNILLFRRPHKGK
mmetsp:Transcript_1184/g.2010  ORF Transcript_1184/g.2010 Transcript_1184/m.2010 type:complete len:83 (-) Transcript_1184:237-485(-)|eukprot:CAMPEP_0169111158 /NCGR_PEP_ID=MMETSP1015-20121227/26914_1 /TAXON_ID=342587 /ORGANISM="Karlodinium micrum, Strain CCMP2283" /LENGTH=82 /DNA_ID=CAMNT_0009173033 /DNA_START=101 /DNA_END=349 /DNA_ORIENTATION=-